MKQKSFAGLGLKFDTMVDLENAANAEYYEELRQVKKHYKFHRSCGTVITVAVNGHTKVSTADCWEFKYTFKQFMEITDQLTKEYPESTISLTLWGRFDGYESPEDFKYNNYIPEVGSWELDLGEFSTITRQMCHEVVDV